MRISDWSSDVCSSDLRFFNPDGGEDFTVPKGRSRGGVLARWFLGADERPEWPENVAVQPSKPQMNVQSGEMKAVWVGNATVLVQAGGLKILSSDKRRAGKECVRTCRSPGLPNTSKTKKATEAISKHITSHTRKEK